jgi:hypothetical protein
MSLLRRAGFVAGATACLTLVAGPASAHDCFITYRAPASGGIVGIIDAATGSFTPTGRNGAFVKVVFPDGSAVYGFAHSAGEIHDYVLPAANNCDGRGIESAEVCFGG